MIRFHKFRRPPKTGMNFDRPRPAQNQCNSMRAKLARRRRRPGRGVHQPGLGHPANKWPWPELISAAASSRSCPRQKQWPVVMQGVIMVPAAWAASNGLKDPVQGTCLVIHLALPLSCRRSLRPESCLRRWCACRRSCDHGIAHCPQLCACSTHLPATAPARNPARPNAQEIVVVTTGPIAAG